MHGSLDPRGPNLVNQIVQQDCFYKLPVLCLAECHLYFVEIPSLFVTAQVLSNTRNPWRNPKNLLRQMTTMVGQEAPQTA